MQQATWILALFVAVALLAATPAGAAKAPIGKTYFVVSIGLSTEAPEAYVPDVGCIRFTRDQLCESDGTCGDWRPTEDVERAPKQSPFAYEFEFIDDETGELITVEGVGRIDMRGPKSSIAAVGMAIEPTSGIKLNFAIAGRAVGPARCQQLVEDFVSGE
jgi:hypothetical protein